MMLILDITAMLLSLNTSVGFEARPNLSSLPTVPSWVMQKTDTISATLLKLPRPKGAPSKMATMFMANAHQQQGLNFQTKGKPQPSVDFYRQSLTKLGYQERTINATVGDWGFSLVFDAPPSAGLMPKDPAKKVVLVIQGTMLAADTINLNLRFEEI